MTIVFAFGAILLTAQTEQGKCFLQGSSNLGLDFGKNKYKHGGTTYGNYKYFEFEFTPMAGYTIIDNLPVGLFMDVDLYKKTDIEDDDFSSTNSFSFGPFARYYFLDLDGFKPFAEAGIGIGTYSHKYDWGDGEEKDNAFAFEFWAGVGGTYFFTDSFGLDAMIGYEKESYKYKAEDDEEEGSTDMYGYIFFNVGIVVMLGK